MTAYVVAEIEITDPAGYQEYKQLAPASVAAYGGKFLVRGGTCVTLEGSSQPPRVVVIEFPSLARARQWWDSPEYRTAKEQRQRTARTEMIVVEGIA